MNCRLQAYRVDSDQGPSLEKRSPFQFDMPHKWSLICWAQGGLLTIKSLCVHCWKLAEDWRKSDLYSDLCTHWAGEPSAPVDGSCLQCSIDPQPYCVPAASSNSLGWTQSVQCTAYTDCKPHESAKYWAGQMGRVNGARFSSEKMLEKQLCRTSMCLYQKLYQWFMCSSFLRHRTLAGSQWPDSNSWTPMTELRWLDFSDWTPMDWALSSRPPFYVQQLRNSKMRAQDRSSRLKMLSSLESY